MCSKPHEIVVEKRISSGVESGARRARKHRLDRVDPCFE